MREIKFRVLISGAWYYWGFINHNTFIGIPDHPREDIEWVKKHSQQYTGLKDKNGKEVYEGDIIKSDTSYPLEVYWMGVAWGVRWKDMGNQKEGIICDDGGDMTIEKGDKLIYFEIIGNIFENKGEK